MTTYTTSQGDVWDLISYKVYGDEGYIDYLIKANSDKRHILVFSSDVELRIPDKPEPSPISLLPPWKQR